jgi:predicted ATPase
VFVVLPYSRRAEMRIILIASPHVLTSRAGEAKFLVDWHLVALPLIQEQSESDPLRIFKSWLARMLILAPHPSAITGDSEGDGLTPNREVTNLGEWFSGLIAHKLAAYTLIDRFIKHVVDDFEDIKNPNTGKDSRSLMVQFQQGPATFSLPFDALSDGEKCLFVCALVLASNIAYGPLLCFWDEPDNYLSLSEVGHFVMELRRAFESKGGQLLVTSHNPEAIRQFSDENTLLLFRKSHFEPTLVRKITDVKVHGDLVDALIRNDVEP